MSFWCGDVNLGPAFQASDEIEQLERAGFDKTLAFRIIEQEGQAMPDGVPEEATRLLNAVIRGDVVISGGARWTLEQLSVRKGPQT